MAIASAATNLNYLEDDTDINTRINIFKYQRPRPNAKMLMVPVSFMTLPLPVNMPSDHYSMNIGEQDLGFLGNATDIKDGAGLSKLKESLKEKLNVSFVNALKIIIENVDLSDDGEYNAHLLNLNFLMEYFPFKRFEQQDAHECILSFLDLIKETENLFEPPEEEIKILEGSPEPLDGFEDLEKSNEILQMDFEELA